MAKHHFVVIADMLEDYYPEAAFDSKEEAVEYANAYKDDDEFSDIHSIAVYDMWDAPASQTAYREIYRRKL